MSNSNLPLFNLTALVVRDRPTGDPLLNESSTTLSRDFFDCGLAMLLKLCAHDKMTICVCGSCLYVCCQQV